MKHLQSTRRSALMVVDVQENHFPHCQGRQEALDTMIRVVETAKVLGVPIVLTEHHPKVFGRTVAPLASATAGIEPMAKIHFSCLGDPKIGNRVEQMDLRHLVLVGTETHICICQTALHALELGLTVAVVADAVTGRRSGDHDLALARMRAHGVDVLPWESLAYEWMRRAGTDPFRRVLPLVKAESLLPPEGE